MNFINILKVLGYSLLYSLIFSVSLSYAAPNNFYKFHYGFNLETNQVDDLHEGTILDPKIGSKAYLAGLYIKGEPYQFFQFEAGVDYIYIKDSQPFTQDARSQITNEVKARKSIVNGKSIHLSLGPKFDIPIADNITVGVLAGFRWTDLSRSIFICGTCDNQSIDNFKNNYYAMPFIEYQFTRHNSVTLFYSHYFERGGFESGVGIKFTFYAM